MLAKLLRLIGTAIRGLFWLVLFALFLFSAPTYFIAFKKLVTEEVVPLFKFEQYPHVAVNIGWVDVVFGTPEEIDQINQQLKYQTHRYGVKQVLEFPRASHAGQTVRIDFGGWEEQDCNTKTYPISFVPDSSYFSVTPRSGTEAVYEYNQLKEFSNMSTLIGCATTSIEWRSRGQITLLLSLSASLRIVVPYGIGARYALAN
jgi:hypothetical protein